MNRPWTNRYVGRHQMLVRSTAKKWRKECICVLSYEEICRNSATYRYMKSVEGDLSIYPQNDNRF